MTEQEKLIRLESIEFAKKNKKKIAKEIACKEKYPPENGKDDQPISWFMAGAPGTGKTETSIELLRLFEESPGGRPFLRIDPDELRNKFEKYDGGNSWLFQAAVSILVEKIFDVALKQEQTLVLDGTLSNLSKAKGNIERSLGRCRRVLVTYLYQDPLVAWEFVKAREKEERRKIPQDVFITQYFESRRVVNEIISEFGGRIEVFLIAKDQDCDITLHAEVVDSIDTHIPETYDPKSLTEALELSSKHEGN